MTIKTVTHPASGKTFKLGRTRPKVRPKLRLGNYLLDDVPTPPASGHYSPKAEHVLADVYLNDQLGDCVIAGAAHALGVFTGNAGQTPAAFSGHQIIDAYSAIGGYDPSQTDRHGNNPTDGGCDEQAMLEHWRTQGLWGHRVAGWVAVEPQHAKTAMWLFENLIFGVEMPDEWLDPMPTGHGFKWDAAGPPNMDNGHCFVGVGWNMNGIQIDTWGMIGTLTDAALNKYVTKSAQGELYTAISQEAIDRATQTAPNGLDWTALTSHFALLGGSVSA